MIYIIRHGQTAWNLEKRKQGQKDSPLTHKGIQQAIATAGFINNDIDDVEKYKFVISPQWRCQQYASIICDLVGVRFADCMMEEDLREHSFGAWEGKTEEEIELEFPNLLGRRYEPENYWNFIVPMGESYELLSDRVLRVINKYEGQNIIFICHEMVSKVMRGHLLKMDNSNTLSLKHPQDTIYQIHNSKLSALKVI